MNGSVILITAEVRAFIQGLSSNSGRFTLRWSEPELCGIIVAAGAELDDLTPFVLQNHFLRYADAGPTGRWFRGTAEHQQIWEQAAARGAAVPIEEMRGRLPGELFHVGHNRHYFAAIESPNADGHSSWTGWIVTSDDLLPIHIDVERDDEGLATLGDNWPTESLRRSRVAVVGVGSIGSATAIAIAQHGVGRISLIDPDRFEFHNLVRHQLARSDVGRFKSDALRDTIQRSHPSTTVVATHDDVVQQADSVRATVEDADVIIGATDGVIPRRSLVHLARRLGKPALLGCVLLDGALGEIMRFRPVDTHGCLECRRRAHPELFEMDASLEVPYGTGDDHRPMTALGTDLELLGRFLAKAAIATLLESQGFADQRLASETAIIGLRPSGSAPPPYDLRRTGEVRWLPADAPQPGCPTCGSHR